MKNAVNAASSRLTGVHRDEDLAAERAVYTEIGRIVGVPFSVEGVYERFADQVAKIIPFDLIVITHVDWERDQIKLMYGIGLDTMGLAEGDTISLKDSVVSEVANAKKAIRTDQHQYGGSLGRSLADSGLMSRIATPLIANDKVVGTLHLASGMPNVYGNLELARLEIVGNQIAGAIASSILLEAERDRASQLQSFYDVSAILALPLAFDEKARRIVDALAITTKADHVVLRRGGSDQNSLILVGSSGLESIGFQQTLKLTEANHATRQAFLTGEPIKINDYGIYPDAQPDLLSQGVRSLYFVPIKSGNRILGSITVASKTPNFFDVDHVGLITAFSNEIWSLFNPVDQADKLLESQEAALEKERQNTRLHNGLYQITRIFAEAGDFKGKATAALEILVNLAGADWSTLRITNDTGPGFHLAAAVGSSVEKSPPPPVIPQEQIFGEGAFSDGAVTVITDHAGWPGFASYLLDMGMQSLVLLPIKVSERTLGVVSVISKEKNAFGKDLVDILTSVVDGLGNLLEISILQDQSEKTHRELERLTEELYSSNWELEQFANIASHDLQEPLRMVSSYTQLLESRYKDKLDADALEFIGYAVDGAKRMQTQIRDLLAYSRLTTQGTPFESTDCLEVLRRATANLTMSIQESDAVITNDHLPLVNGDTSQLISVFQNLIGNGIKYVNYKKPRVHISAVENGDDWLFSVRDNGIGMEGEFADRIFLIFKRLNSREEYAGTGIGLAVCKKVVERHGGNIWVESELGKGSTIYFTLAKTDNAEKSHNEVINHGSE